MNDPAPVTRGVALEIPLRWGDMDALGHVNNTVYFRFCESARIAYFEAIQLEDFKRKATDGPGLVAASLNFRRQMRYPGAVIIEAHTRRVGGKSFHLDYELRDAADGSVVADGSSVCVWVDYQASRALPLPAALKQKIADLEGEPTLAET
jgi:acyl-CoA thioester hydrolase